MECPAQFGSLFSSFLSSSPSGYTSIPSSPGHTNGAGTKKSAKAENAEIEEFLENCASSICSFFSDCLTSITNGINGLFADSPEDLSRQRIENEAVEDEVAFQDAAVKPEEKIDTARYNFALQLISVENLDGFAASEPIKQDKVINQAVNKLNEELAKLNKNHPITPQADKPSDDKVLNKKILREALDRMPQTFFVRVLQKFVAGLPTADPFINLNEAAFISFLMSQAVVEIKRESRTQQEIANAAGMEYRNLKRKYDVQVAEAEKKLAEANPLTAAQLKSNLDNLTQERDSALAPKAAQLDKIDNLNRQKQWHLKVAETLEFLSYVAWLMPDYHGAFNHLLEANKDRFTPNRNVTTSFNFAIGAKVGVDLGVDIDIASLGVDDEKAPVKAYAKLLFGVSYKNTEFVDHEGYLGFIERVFEIYINAKGELKCLFDFNSNNEDNGAKKLGLAALLDINVAPHSVGGGYKEYGTYPKFIRHQFHNKDDYRSNANNIEYSGHRYESLIEKHRDDEELQGLLSRFSRLGIKTDLYDWDEVADIDVVMEKFENTYKQMQQTLSLFVSSTNLKPLQDTEESVPYEVQHFAAAKSKAVNELNEVKKAQIKSQFNESANSAIEEIKHRHHRGIGEVRRDIKIEQDRLAAELVRQYGRSEADMENNVQAATKRKEATLKHLNEQNARLMADLKNQHEKEIGDFDGDAQQIGALKTRHAQEIKIAEKEGQQRIAQQIRGVDKEIKRLTNELQLYRDRKAITELKKELQEELKLNQLQENLKYTGGVEALRELIARHKEENAIFSGDAINQLKGAREKLVLKMNEKKIFGNILERRNQQLDRDKIDLEKEFGSYCEEISGSKNEQQLIVEKKEQLVKDIARLDDEHRASFDKLFVDINQDQIELKDRTAEISTHKQKINELIEKKIPVEKVAEIDLKGQDVTSKKINSLVRELVSYRDEDKETKLTRQFEADIKIHEINAQFRINKLNINFLFELLPLGGDEARQQRKELIEESGLKESDFPPQSQPTGDKDKFEAICRKYKVAIEKERAKSQIEELKLVHDFEVAKHKRVYQPHIDKAHDELTQLRQNQTTKWGDEALEKETERTELVFHRDQEIRKKEHHLKLAELALKKKFDLVVAENSPGATSARKDKINEEYELKLLRITAKFDKDELKHKHDLHLAYEKCWLEYQKAKHVDGAEDQFLIKRAELQNEYAARDKSIDRELKLNKLDLKRKFDKGDQKVTGLAEKKAEIIKRFDQDSIRRQYRAEAKREDDRKKANVNKNSKRTEAENKLALMKKYAKAIKETEIQQPHNLQLPKKERLNKLEEKPYAIQHGAMKLITPPDSEKSKQKEPLQSTEIRAEEIELEIAFEEESSGEAAKRKQTDTATITPENDYANWAAPREEEGIELPHPTLARDRIYLTDYKRGQASLTLQGTAAQLVASATAKVTPSANWLILERDKFTPFGVRLTSPLKSIEEKEGLKQKIKEQLDSKTPHAASVTDKLAFWNAPPANPMSVKETILNGWKAGAENTHFTIEQCMKYLQQDNQLYAQCFDENGIIPGYETMALELQKRYAAQEPWEIIKHMGYFIGHLIGLADYGDQYQVASDTPTPHYIDKKEVIALQEKLKEIENDLFNLKASKKEHWMEWGIGEYATVYVEAADVKGSIEGAINLGGFVAGRSYGGNKTWTNRMHPVAGRDIPTDEVTKSKAIFGGSNNLIPDEINGPLRGQFEQLLADNNDILNGNGLDEDPLGVFAKSTVEWTQTDRYYQIPRLHHYYQKLGLPVPGKVLAYSYDLATYAMQGGINFTPPLMEYSHGLIPVNPTFVLGPSKSETRMLSETYSPDTFNHFDIFHSHGMDVGDKNKYWYTGIKNGQRTSLQKLWCKLGKEQLEENREHTPLSNELAVRSLEFKENKVLDPEMYWEFDDATQELREMATYLYALTDGKSDLDAMKKLQKAQATQDAELGEKIYVLDQTISMARQFFLIKGMTLDSGDEFDAGQLYEYCFDIYDKWEVAYYPHVRELFENSVRLDTSTVGVDGVRYTTYDEKKAKENNAQRSVPQSGSPSPTTGRVHHKVPTTNLYDEFAAMHPIIPSDGTELQSS